MVMLYGVADGKARLPRVLWIKPQSHSRILQAEEQILERVEEESEISIRRLAAGVGISQFVMHRTLKEQGLHPYHVRKVQVCEWLLQQCRELTFS